VNRSIKFGRPKKPFDPVAAGHIVSRVAESLGWDMTDTESFLRRAQHVEYGLSAEIEFATILRWLGWCRFVHRLNEDVLKDPAYSTVQVPDLLAVFELGHEQFTALIEVKTEDELTLRFKKSYLEQLRSYASLLNQPLLIAWRPRQIGIWTLFDASIAEPLDEDHVQVSLDRAFKNDLMSFLAGDYVLIPERGAGLRIEAKRTGEKVSTPDGYEAPFQVSDVYIHDAENVRVEDVPNSIMWMIFSAMDHREQVHENAIIQSFLANGGMTRAQLVLRTAVGFSLAEEERIHWKVVGENLDTILTSRGLLADAQARFGSFVQYIFHQEPQTIPTFLPAYWHAIRRGVTSPP
jgi:Holliday junction resolvase